MSTDIFNAWEVLAASTVATIITGGVAVAWAQGRLSVAQQYWAAGEAEFDKAERLAAEVERTRNLPWYWPTDPHVTGELVAVSMAAEQFDELAASIDVPDDAPALRALSDRSHADEQADHTDTDRAGMWRVLLGLVSDLVDRVHDWLPNLLRQRAERDKVGSGEQATDVDPFAELLAHATSQPPTNPTYKSWHLNDMTAQYEVVKPGRHRAEPEMPAINASIPAQRTGEVEV